jgi:5'-deoxynucleotidase YfbR-like HD superfamily hydrolase
LLTAARYHDEAERQLGDMPAPAKERFPALAAAYAKAELQVLTEMGHVWNLSRKESDILALCDKLDAWLWATKHGARGLEYDAMLDGVYRIANRIGPDAVAWLGDKQCP